MAKPKKSTKDKPPQVTDDQTPESSTDTPTPDSDAEIAAKPADETAQDAPETPVETTEDGTQDIAARDRLAEEAEASEGFVWSDTVEQHDPDKPQTADSDTEPSAQTDKDGEDAAESALLLTDPADPAPDSDVDPEPETKTEDAPPQPAPAVVSPRPSFWPAVFGGIVAALLGFIAGRGDMLDAYLPRANAPEPVDLTPLTDDITALSDRISALESVEPVEVVDVSADLGDLSQSLASVETALQSLTARIDEVEARPDAPAPPPPQPDNSEELAALQSAIGDLEARLAEEDARASAEAARLLAQAALTRVMTAVETGESFEPALGALEEVAPVEVPEALRTAATDGVPSMAALRDGFPEAARAGLAAARAEIPESEVSGLGGFLRRQLGARSVTPREGSDPDAILSRAEAALRSGDLDTAIAETDALPEAAKAAMQDWLSGAQARKQASDAAKSLSDSLTVN